jgi:hypothetical protein
MGQIASPRIRITDMIFVKHPSVLYSKNTFPSGGSMASDAQLQILYEQIKSVTDAHVNWQISHTRHADGSIYFNAKRNGNRIAEGTLANSEYYQCYLQGFLCGMAVNAG